MEKRGINNLNFYINKKAQVTIFIIIAVVILGLVALFLVLKATILPGQQIPTKLEPVYQGFWDCINEKTLIGVSILESQGGYIQLPEFEAGSAFAPFSSQLNFLGNPVPYWYYISGNGFSREQVPSKEQMQKDLADFVKQKVEQCDFDSYIQQGFSVLQGNVTNVNVKINDADIDVNLDKNLDVSLGEERVQVENHNVVVNSNLGRLYSSARKVYDYEQNNLFLEKYGLDVLRLYAPTDGVEVSCSPKIWSADNVFNDLQEAIVENTFALKVKGGDYKLKNQDEKYFVVDIPVSDSVNFMTSKNWPYSFEVTPSNGNLLVANPIGNQQGLGMLGFCYIPYHFVYNIKYPVLIQVSRGDEIFQFPMAVVIQGNNPRNPVNGSEAISSEIFDVCSAEKSSSVNLRIYDEEMNAIKDAQASFKCLGSECDLGDTDEAGSLNVDAPQCLNAIINVKAKGFKNENSIISTNNYISTLNIFMTKEYEKKVNLKLDDSDYNEEAIINFNSEDESKTIVYPTQKTISLSEGQYSVEVYIYRAASIKLDEVKKEQCMQIPQSGIGGIFGLTKEKCVDIVIPAQTISSALAGGGKQNYYFSKEELSGSGNIEINAQSLPTPTNLDDLQESYILFDTQNLDITVQ